MARPVARPPATARRIARLGAALFVAAALVVSAAFAQPAPPALTAPVNDFAGVIDPASAASLDRLIRALQAASGDVVKTFQPWGDIQSYATKMFENEGRGIGQKGKDNGLLVLLAVDDRQVRLEVGYDLEGVVTDGFAGAAAECQGRESGDQSACHCLDPPGDVAARTTRPCLDHKCAPGVVP